MVDEGNGGSKEGLNQKFGLGQQTQTSICRMDKQ